MSRADTGLHVHKKLADAVQMIVLVRRTLLNVAVFVAVVLPASAVALPNAHPSRGALASYRCGSFPVPGLVTRVHVKVVRGSVACSTAKAVMKWTFTTYESSFVRRHAGWTTYGPQTCYAWATKAGKQISGKC